MQILFDEPEEGDWIECPEDDCFEEGRVQEMAGEMIFICPEHGTILL